MDPLGHRAPVGPGATLARFCATVDGMALPRPTEEQRLAICEWLTANGINPNTVPLDTQLAIRTEDDGTKVIHCEEYVLTDDGHIQVDPEDPDRAWVRNATAPCTVDPPASLRVTAGID